MTRESSPQPTISQTQILEAVAAVSDAVALAQDLDTFLQRVVDTLRHLLETDRVVVYRFLPDDDGVIAAESVGLPWRSLRGELIYDPCFAEGWGDRYRQGGVGMIADTGQSNLEPCYADLLTRLQVQANLVVPVFSGTHLWALLIAHHCRSPRRWHRSSLSLLQHVARQLGQGVYQNELQAQILDLRRQVAGQPSGHQSEQLFQLFTEHVEQILFIRDAVSGQFLYVSAAYDRIWGESRSALYNDPGLWLRRIHPDDRAEVESSVVQQFDGLPVQRQYRIVRPDSAVRWIQAQVRPVEDDRNQICYLVGWAEDCTDRRRLQIDLQNAKATLSHRVEQEQLLRALTARVRESLHLTTILNATVAGIKTVFKADRAVIFQLLPNGDRRIVQQATDSNYSPIAQASIPPGPLPDSYLEQLRVGQPIIFDGMTSDIWSPRLTTFLTSFQVQSALVAPIIHPFGGDGQPVWGILVVHACGEYRQWQPFEANMLQHFADQLTTALHQAELYRQLQAANRELDRIAKIDSLTQLANRRWLDDYLAHEWQKLARQRQPLSVILADVDFFKPYNDTYGHAAGDQCLVQIAGAIRAGVRRPADLAARYGGEEFALVLPNTDTAGAIRVVEMVRHHLRRLALPHRANPHGSTITLSFGIATLMPTPGDPNEGLLEAADQALYTAKAAGRDQYQVFHPEANPPASFL